MRGLGGAARAGRGRPSLGGGRARNAKSLIETVEDILSKASEPMSVGDIVQAVEGAGYSSNSANFRGIVNQTLIKERRRFAKAGRGLYQMKDGKKAAKTDGE